MAGHIDCRNCDSWCCDGCNIYRLSKMLDNGKLDRLMDEHHSINTTADVVEVVRCKDCKHWNNGHCWGVPFVGDDASYVATEETDYCSYGEAKMDGKGEG